MRIICLILLFTFSASLFSEDKKSAVLPKNILVSTQFSDSIDGDLQKALTNSVVDWVGSLEHRLFIGIVEDANFVPDMRVTVEFTVDENAQISYTMEISGGELVEAKTFKSLEPLRPDPRFRNIGAILFEPFSDRAKTYFKPGSSIPKITFIALPKTRLWVNGQLTIIDETGKFLSEIPRGFYVKYDAFLDGYQAVHGKINIPATEPEFSIEIKQIPFQNPFAIHTGLLYLSYPSLGFELPLDKESLFLNIPVNFYGVGINLPNERGDQQQNYGVSPTLSKFFNDQHLLELGIGINWYMDNGEWDIKPVFGADLLVRFDLQGKYFLDLLNPLSIRLTLGLDFKVSETLNLGIHFHPSYTLSFDPDLILAVQTDKFQASNEDILKEVTEFLRNKYILGPGIIELLAPEFSLRIRL